MYFFHNIQSRFKKNVFYVKEQEDNNGHWQPPTHRRVNRGGKKDTFESTQQPTLPNVLPFDTSLPFLPNIKHRSQYPAYIEAISNRATLPSKALDAVPTNDTAEPIQSSRDQPDRLEVYRRIIETIIEKPNQRWKAFNDSHADFQYERYLVWAPPLISKPTPKQPFSMLGLS